MNGSDDPTKEAPAPWELRGSAYICFLRCTHDFLVKQSFVPDVLRESFVAEQPTIMIYVNYQQSPVGAYHELLFIPGRFKFQDELVHPSITRIFVSSMDSVINGRNNWGIPKELADFKVTREGSVDSIEVTRETKKIVELTFQSWPIAIPFTTRLIPKSWHTLAQFYMGKTFIYSPKASGWLRKAQLVAAKVSPDQFPPITTDQAIGTLYLPRFKMHFPEARIMT